MNEQSFQALLQAYDASGLKNAKKSTSTTTKGGCPNPDCAGGPGDDRFYITHDKRLWGCNVCSPGASNKDAFKAIMRTLGVDPGNNGQVPARRGRPKKVVVSNVRPIELDMDSASGPWNYGFDGGRPVLRKVSKTGGWQHVKDGKWEKGSGPYLLPHYAPRPAIVGVKTVLIVEGEKDAINLSKQLNAAHIVSGASGAGSAVNGLDALLERDEPKVCVVYDCDETGRDGAKREGRRIKKDYPSLVVKTLDLSPDRNDGYDLTDYLEEHGVDVFKRHLKANVVDVVYSGRGRPGATVVDNEKDTSILPDDAPEDVRLLFPGALPVVAVSKWFVSRYADCCRYVKEREKWLVLDEHGIWIEDDNLALQMVHDLIDEYKEKACPNPGKERKSVVMKMDAARYVPDVLSVSSRVPAMNVEMSDLDTAPYLLGTPSGVWDLRTLEKVGADSVSGEYVTKRTSVDPERHDVDNTDDKFVRFMYDLASRPLVSDEQVATEQANEIYGWLCEQLGYALTGYTSHRTFMFLSGNTKNGKSVLLMICDMIWGDYAASAPDGVFEFKRNEDHPSGLTAFSENRLVMLDEEEARRWNVKVLKKVTGRGKMTARYMGKDWFDFVPKCKLIIASNKHPKFEAEPAIMERLRALEVQFQTTPENRIKDFEIILFNELGSRILWKVMEYANRWITRYIKDDIDEWVCDAVRDQSENLARGGDDYKAFVDDCLFVSGDSKDAISSKCLKTMFMIWADDNGLTCTTHPSQITKYINQKIMIHKPRVKHTSRKCSVYNVKCDTWAGIRVQTDAADILDQVKNKKEKEDNTLKYS